MRSKSPRVNVLGVGISAINMEMALSEVARWIDTQEHHYVCVTGVHGVMESQRDPALKRIHNESGLTTPDGVPMVWAAHWAGAEQVSRVYGPELMLSVCDQAARHNWSSFFYGGKEGVPELLTERLVTRFPGLRIAGSYSPPFRPLTEDEDRGVVETINASGADIVWIGLSTPKQEHWMAEHREKLTASVLVGVGAAFDMNAGLLPQAPPYVQRLGFEWAFRLMKEPRRLWKRYLRNNPAFLARIMVRRPFLIGADESP
jgi:N-acetylglucosaminyldiphosphoundecaprenol N-acetyl-beta-D-mannosaminyltransferase